MTKTAKKSIRVLIVDDEPLARRTIITLLRDDPEIEIISECRNGMEAVKAINSRTPDLVFLDIQMPVMSGFAVLEKIVTEPLPAIIFVTAYDQYALKAFEVHALDYLLKPFNDQRFTQALGRAKKQIEQRELNHLGRQLIGLLSRRDEAALDARTTFLSRLLIRNDNFDFVVKVDEIDWIEADDYYAKLHVGRKSHLLRQTMNELESNLDPAKFLRIHRSTIVNIDRIKEIHPHPSGDRVIILSDDSRLKLSRSRIEHAQRVFRGLRKPEQ